MTDASASAIGDRWVDGKRREWLLSLLPVLLPWVALVLVTATGLNAFWWFGFVFAYGVIVPLELLVGEDPTNPPESAVPALEADPYYAWIVAAFAPLQYAAFVMYAWAAARGGLGPVEMLGLALSAGFMNGVGIANAHELGHKPTWRERWLAKIVLAPTAYGHFVVEHNRGHHVRVATPEDPTSARMGESFWAFWPRTVFGSLRSAWALEKERLARAGQGPWTPRNDVLNAWIMTPVLFGALILWLGTSIIPFLIIQAIVGFSLLEVVNYLEHYGLKRQKGPDGRYERCKPEHSWNSNRVASNVQLYHLQRHSDHHANAMRRYQALRHFDDAPQLPTGYAGMTLLAYFPPLWRKVMDPRLVAHYGGDLSRINIHPPAEAAIRAKWGAASVAEA